MGLIGLVHVFGLVGFIYSSRAKGHGLRYLNSGSDPGEISISRSTAPKPTVSRGVRVAVGLFNFKNLFSFSIKEDDLSNIREAFDILSSFTLHTATDLSKACSLQSGQICFYEAAFKVGLRLPMPTLAKELIFWSIASG